MAQYCEAQHLVVSLTGDPYGFVDRVLEQQGRRRRVTVTVPNFMFALPVIADTDLIAAVPRQFAAMHSQRFGVITREAPLLLDGFRLNAVTPKVAMMDAGVAWLFGVLGRKEATAKKPAKRESVTRGATRARK
jgi:DNA-binding transcriptional LysR family regulator